jgi:hypothetical protein
LGNFGQVFCAVTNSTHFLGLERFTAILLQDLVPAPAAAETWILAHQNPI